MKRGILLALFAAWTITIGLAGRASATTSTSILFEGGPLNGQRLNASPFINWLEYEEDGVVLTVYRYEPKFPNWSTVLQYVEPEE